MRNPKPARHSCLASNRLWRQEASALRALAGGRHLTEAQRERLLREAVAADRMADAWLAAAIEDG